MKGTISTVFSAVTCRNDFEKGTAVFQLMRV